MTRIIMFFIVTIGLYILAPIVAIIYFYFERQKEKREEKKHDYSNYWNYFRQKN